MSGMRLTSAIDLDTIKKITAKAANLNFRMARIYRDRNIKI